MQEPPPQSIKVFGVLNLVFAGLGFFAFLFLAAVLFGGMKLLDVTTADMEDAVGSGYMTYLKITLVVAVIETIALLVSGIGLLKLRPWGRTLAIAYAIFSLATTAIGIAVTLTMLDDPSELASDLRGVVYPVLLLAFMLGARVRTWFASNP
jgi:hypothetical protein